MLEQCILDVPCSTIVALSDSILSEDDHGLVLLTDPRQWAYSAEAKFDIPGIDRTSKTIVVRAKVEAGAVGVGWVSEDGRNWLSPVTLKSGTGETVARLTVPTATVGGKLVFRNEAENGPAQASIRSIEVVASEAEVKFFAGLEAEERGDITAAINNYKEALKLDPTHVEAIAGLGRLRFVPPPQPILDEWKRRSPQPDFCEVMIEVRNPCNYRCFYCVAEGYNNERVRPINLPEIERTYQLIDRNKNITSIYECGGGEPTVHPQFAELLQLSLRYGNVSFPTNNSQNPRRWLPRETTDNYMIISAALHPEGEDKVQRFLDNTKFILDSNNNVRFTCLYIAHPTRFSKISHYGEMFRKENIRFYAVPFIGTYNGKSYPHAYSETDKAILEEFAQQDYMSDLMVKISPHVNRVRNFRGIPCQAGHRRLHIGADGQLQRCLYDDYAMSAPVDIATPCAVGSCGCGIFLEHLDWGDTYYRDSPVYLDDLARGFGHADASAGIAAEYRAKYDALMAAYGKDEFKE
jgi:organic radical activating enzyme